MDPVQPAGTAPARRKLDLLLSLRGGAASAGDGIPRRTGGGPAPLSFGQERLWLLYQLDPSITAYNVRGAYRLPRVDAAALERALGEIVRRHEVLRTTFAEVDGAAVQIAAPSAGFTLPVDDLSALGAAEREETVGRLAVEHAAPPFDLGAGPLFRARLLQLGGEGDVLLLAMHHAVSDGWSMRVLFRELSALYAAFREGRPSPLAEPALQFADYAAWERARLGGSALDGQLAHWRTRLAGAPALLELPLDHPRPAVQTYRGARESLDLPLPLLERLKALGHGEGATPFMVLLAAFQVLLGKYAGTDDVVVGTPVAGRTRHEVEELLGFFANTLVLRTDLSGDLSFRELLRRVRDVTLDAYDHQEVPFERLVAELQPERSLGHSPLFQVAFTFESAREPAAESQALPARGIEIDAGTAQFDLTLSTLESSQGLHASLTYATSLFEAATIRRMLAHLSRLLEQVADDADARLSQLELMDGAERNRVVQEWNETARPYPRDATIPALFDRQVAERPGAVAMVWGDEETTYAGLASRANRLAHHLQRLGVGLESRVGVMMERGPELVVSILAILKAGGCYVPLDPAYPAERLALMVEDAAVRVVLTRENSGDAGDSVDAEHAIAAAGARIVALGSIDLSAEPEDAPVCGATPENLAYIVYTSGSTGRPKGVMVGHREVVQLVVETDFVQLRPGDRVAQASNANFDALAFEVWGAFLTGATLVGIPRDVLLSPPALRTLLREERITTLYQTTALLNQLSREIPDIFATLREVLHGGQAVDAGSIRRLLKSGKPRRLLHVYGPTETTAWCSYEDVRHVADDALTVSVGKPIGNARIYILDDYLNPVPAGVPGEAYVGGEGVVRGYLDRPALTAERFVPDPFSTEAGKRMYRTGDRMRWREGAEVRECGSAGDPRDSGRTDALPHSRTHYLEFVGRLDEQVKIRGFRIEPGEVESALAACEGVREARVVVREDEPGEKRLVAYVVGEADAEALKGHLRHTMPEYMVPSAIVSIPRIPLTPSGKLDTRALPAPELASAEGFVPPRTPAEEVLAEIWAEVLRVERVGATDDFFALGGHSLLAMRVVSRIRQVFGIDLPLRAVFEGSTVAQLAARMEEARRADEPASPPVVPVPRSGALPLSFAQERLWFIDRLQPGTASYNISTGLHLRGALRVAALERALGEIVRRHESLRTTFGERGGAPVQVIAPFHGFTLPVEAVHGGEPEARRRAAQEASRPFDLSAGPLFRPLLLRLGEQEHVLLLTMHHVVSDGWSMRLLFRELAALYAAFAEGRPSPLPEPEVQYADYAAWERAQLHGPALERQLGYWKERLAGAPALLELPTDHPRPAVQTHHGAEARFELSAELLERLRALGRSEGATLYMVLLGAFQALLARLAGTADVVVGSPVAGRARREVEEVVGFFVNTLALRCDLSGDPDFREVLRRVRRTTLEAWDHQEVPFEKLVAEVQPERSLAHAPIFQVLFTLENAEAGPAPLPGIEVSGLAGEMDAVKYDLALALTAGPGGVRGSAAYSTALFERASIDRMLSRLERVLEQVTADPGTRLSRLDLLDAEERRTLEAWSGTPAAPPKACVHEIFARQAAATPDAQALRFAGEGTSYRALDEASNRLAHHLRARGVGPESRVGVFAERAPETVVAILAILKAGGAYVPLDPAYPAERLRFLLEDSGARIVIAPAGIPEGIDPELVADLLDPRAEAAEIRMHSASPPVVDVRPENVAYVIYTSGSTGRPKGVMVTHAGIPRLALGQIERFRIDASSRVLQFASFSFDAAVSELFTALLSGATLVLAPRDELLPGAGLLETMRRERITVVTLPPSVLAVLSPDELPDLRTLVSAGEAVGPAVVERWGDGRVFINAYGPTETTVGPCAAVCEPDGRTPPIGRPLPGVRAWVLDAAGGPVPVGVPGELYIGGPGVARGYLHRPAQTAERFVPHPFAGGGARLYRTGDRARWRGDGQLEFLGRVDAQVKVRGFRVEPGEIEALLRGAPGVDDCAVVVRGDVPGGRLVAYVAGPAQAGELRERLRRELPEYMVPATFVALDRLPLSANGKVDRRALPAPADAAGTPHLSPRSAAETAVAAAWQEVLGVDRVGVHDNFFDLGGSSLLLYRVYSLLRELRADLRVVDLFRYPTVEALAGHLDQDGARDAGLLAQSRARADERRAARRRVRA
jgi:amino acid adenylation domain-containing protein